MEIPFRGSSDWLTPSPSTAEGPQRLRHDERRVGTFTGHQRGPLPGHQWGLCHGHGQSSQAFDGPSTSSQLPALDSAWRGIKGRIHIVMQDGSETEAGPGDILVLPPGHDA